MKKKLLPVLVLTLLFAGRAYTQATGSDYETALGFKFYPGAISAKHFFRSNTALEGLAYFYNDGVRFTGLYEIHGDINGVEGLRWYAGPGAHIGFWSDRWKDRYPDREGGLTIGVDGVLGLDYRFNNVPFNVSIDWQPSVNIIGYRSFEGGWGGLGIRYTIK